MADITHLAHLQAGLPAKNRQMQEFFSEKIRVQNENCYLLPNIL